MVPQEMRLRFRDEGMSERARSNLTGAMWDLESLQCGCNDLTSTEIDRDHHGAAATRMWLAELRQLSRVLGDLLYWLRLQRSETPAGQGLEDRWLSEVLTHTYVLCPATARFRGLQKRAGVFRTPLRPVVTPISWDSPRRSRSRSPRS